jgi:hypothetical protein
MACALFMVECVLLLQNVFYEKMALYIYMYTYMYTYMYAYMYMYMKKQKVAVNMFANSLCSLITECVLLLQNVFS